MNDKVEKYEAAMHAMQSGVEFLKGSSLEPKHLRVGVNSALESNGALTELLIEKGIFTHDEYMAKLIKYVQMDIDLYKIRLKEKYGMDTDIDLK